MATIDTFAGAEIDAPSNTTISASQSAAAPAPVFQHGVFLAASVVNFGGSTGLTLHADGNGGILAPNNLAFVYLGPTGEVEFSDSEDVTNLALAFYPQQVNSPITYNGSGSSLTATANGTHTFVEANAYPISITASWSTARL